MTTIHSLSSHFTCGQPALKLADWGFNTAL
jgi:hypothetical protein